MLVVPHYSEGQIQKDLVNEKSNTETIDKLINSRRNHDKLQDILDQTIVNVNGKCIVSCDHNVVFRMFCFLSVFTPLTPEEELAWSLCLK